MKKVRHVNNGACEKCLEVLNIYPGFNEQLLTWFKDFQKRNPSAHCAYGGRGKKDQAEFLAKGTSKAAYGQSPHNYNAAIDIFELTLNGGRWDKQWFIEKLEPEVKKFDFLVWGGHFKSFVDRPHIELKNWKELVKQGQLKLVEPA